MKVKSQPTFMLPNNAFGLMTFYNLIFQDRGITVVPHLMPIIFALGDPRIRKLCVIVGPGSGKSLLLSVAYPAFSLGQDSTMTCLGLSAGELLPQGFMVAVMDIIENHPLWKQMFPSVQADKTRGWSTDKGMFVTGHASSDPDPSFFSAGIGSKALTGKHARLIIIDDIHDQLNSSSSEACVKVKETYHQQILGRADPRGARYIVAGRRWNEDDVYGHLRSSGEWVVMELPAVRKGSKKLYWDIIYPEGLTCVFNDPAAEESVLPREIFETIGEIDMQTSTTS